MSGAAYAADIWSDISDATWQSVYRVSAANAATVADGYPDGTFRPDQAVTRGQFAKMVVDGLGISKLSPAVPSFSDVPAAHIFYQHVEGGAAGGIISGFPHWTYRPSNNMVRQHQSTFWHTVLAQRDRHADHASREPTASTRRCRHGSRPKGKPCWPGSATNNWFPMFTARRPPTS